MRELDKLFADAFHDADITLSDIPNIDLYMDQILTLVDEKLAANKRYEDDKLLTKTMVNNYSKEKLITPVKGKKYTRSQITQMLCILNLKQNLMLSDLKHLLGSEGVNFEKTYAQGLEMKTKLRDEMQTMLGNLFGESVDLSDKESVLAFSLALSAGATYLRRICEEIIDRDNEEG